MTDLGTLGGQNSSAAGINARGQIAGTSSIAGDQFAHAFLLRGARMIDLGTLPGGTQSSAQDLNARGQVVGVSSTSGQTNLHPFLWDHGVMRDLGTLGGNYGTALGINNLGQVVGTSNLPSNQAHAFIYSEGRMIDLNNMIAPDSGWILYQASAINNSGQIVGVGRIGNQTHAFLLTPGAVPEPGSLVLLITGVIGGTAIWRRGVRDSCGAISQP
jgi:probable HAF family extracellular repeat protein